MEDIKFMFPHMSVDIVVRLSDDTEYILSNPTYAKELETRIAAYEAKKETVSIRTSDLPS